MKNLLNVIEEQGVSPNNLILAIVNLLGVAHRHGLDDEAREALSDCRITLVIEEKYLRQNDKSG